MRYGPVYMDDSQGDTRYPGLMQDIISDIDVMTADYLIYSILLK